MTFKTFKRVLTLTSSTVIGVLVASTVNLHGLLAGVALLVGLLTMAVCYYLIGVIDGEKKA